MKQNPSIVVKNVYYMLAYAFRDLTSSHFEQVGAEDFDHIHDLFAAILARGVARQTKQGLYREYVEHTEDQATLRGKIDMPGTARLRVANRRELACEFDELSEDNLLNRILKAALVLLLRSPKVDPPRRAALKKLLPYFNGVEDVDPTAIRWSSVRFVRNNQSYRTLIGICRMVVEGMLISEGGQQRLTAFLDDQRMSRLYEKFILEYYRLHWPTLQPRASQIGWDLGEGEATMLPTMQTDVTLTGKDNVLVLDAKYYTKNTQERFDSHTVHSANLYQLFTYVKNKEAAEANRQVAGMLLYARTDALAQPDADWRIGGNRYQAQTLDLGRDFTSIAAQLDEIVMDHFGLGLPERVILTTAPPHVVSALPSLPEGYSQRRGRQVFRPLP